MGSGGILSSIITGRGRLRREFLDERAALLAWGDESSYCFSGFSGEVPADILARSARSGDEDLADDLAEFLPEDVIVIPPRSLPGAAGLPSSTTSSSLGLSSSI